LPDASDWDAQQVNGKCSPTTLQDLQVAVDATVKKQGVFSLCFHPHGWIDNAQVVAMIDYALTRHAGKIRFLSFRDVADRLTSNVLRGHALRSAVGSDNGVRVLDLDRDGFLDVVVGNDQAQFSRVWQPTTGQWQDTTFPVRIVNGATGGSVVETGVRFGVLQSSGGAGLVYRGEPSALPAGELPHGAWHFVAGQWQAVPLLPPVPTQSQGRDRGVRLYDLDDDGVCELLVANADQQTVYRAGNSGWEQQSWTLPAGLAFVDAAGRDAGLRLVDVNRDTGLDLVFSNAERSAVYLFTSSAEGWAQCWLNEPRTSPTALPMIVRADGTNNGAWFRNGWIWVQNEEIGGVAEHHVESRQLGGQAGPPPAALEPTEAMPPSASGL